MIYTDYDTIAVIGSSDHEYLWILPIPPLSKQQEIAEHICNIRIQAKALQQDTANILTKAKVKVEEMF